MKFWRGSGAGTDRLSDKYTGRIDGTANRTRPVVGALRNDGLPAIVAGSYFDAGVSSITGTLVVTLATIVITAAAAVEVQGASTPTLGTLTSSATANVLAQGSLSTTLDTATCSGGAMILVQANLSKTFDEQLKR